MINIGEVILSLRKDMGLTQEKIANVLGVSVAAVSKWETGIAYPDITLLPSIAKFFNCSVDYLLGYKITSYDQIGTIIKEAELLYSQGKKLEVLQLLTKSIVKHPNNIQLKFSLGKYMTYIGCNRKNDEQDNMLGESINLFREVIALSDDRTLIDEAHYLMSNCYMWLGKEEEALDVINNIRTSKNVHPEATVTNILYKMGKVNEGNVKSQENIYRAISDILANINNFVWNNRSDPNLCLEYLSLEEQMLTVFSKGQESFISLELSYCYEGLAWFYCKVNNIDMTLSYLEKAIKLTSLIQTKPEVLTNKHYLNLVEITPLYNEQDNLKQKLKTVIFSDEREEYKKIYELEAFRELIMLLDV